MRLPTEFVRLPYRFDAERLAGEVLAFDAGDWSPHVQGFAGNAAIPLVSLGGEANDAFNGPMKATPHLQRCPYIRQILATFGEVVGRSRLMGLDAGCSVPDHRDVNYHWYNRVRIHIPAVTNPDVLFYCGDTHVHMAAGEAWIFDSWRSHRVENRSEQNRVHLVIDIAGSAAFWRTVAQSEWRCARQVRKPANRDDSYVPFVDGEEPELLTEQYNAPLVMHPGEVDALVIDLVMDMRAFPGNPPPGVHAFEMLLQDFRLEWRRLWSLYGPSRDGWEHYDALIRNFPMPAEQLTLASNRGSANRTFSARVLHAALNTGLAGQYPAG